MQKLSDMVYYISQKHKTVGCDKKSVMDCYFCLWFLNISILHMKKKILTIIFIRVYYIYMHSKTSIPDPL